MTPDEAAVAFRDESGISFIQSAETSELIDLFDEACQALEDADGDAEKAFTVLNEDSPKYLERSVRSAMWYAAESTCPEYRSDLLNRMTGHVD